MRAMIMLLAVKTYRESLVDTAMRTRNHVYADKLANTSRGGSAGVSRGFYGSNIPTHDRSHKAGADLFVTDERDVRGLHHRVGGFDHRHQAFCFNHSECFLHSDAPDRNF